MGKLLAFVLAFVFALTLVLPCTAEARGGGGRGRSYSSRPAHSKGSAVAVKGYFRKNGTYVRPHMRSPRNGSKMDNWSTKGNVNPYTGEMGTKKP